MVAPVLAIFLTDPAVSTSAKDDVRKSLEAACSDAAPIKPVAAVVGSLLSVAEDPPVATRRQFCSILTQLQQCRDDPTSNSASLLHRLFAMLQYFKFHRRLPSPKLIENICMALFPTSLSRSASIQELVTPALKDLPLEVVLEYGGLLIDCLIETDAAMSCLIDISIKLLGSAACLEGNEVLEIHNFMQASSHALDFESGFDPDLDSFEHLLHECTLISIHIECTSQLKVSPQIV